MDSIRRIASARCRTSSSNPASAQPNSPRSRTKSRSLRRRSASRRDSSQFPASTFARRRPSLDRRNANGHPADRSISSTRASRDRRRSKNLATSAVENRKSSVSTVSATPSSTAPATLRPSGITRPANTRCRLGGPRCSRYASSATEPGCRRRSNSSKAITNGRPRDWISRTTNPMRLSGPAGACRGSGTSTRFKPAPTQARAMYASSTAGSSRSSSETQAVGTPSCRSRRQHSAISVVLPNPPVASRIVSRRWIGLARATSSGRST